MGGGAGKKKSVAKDKKEMRWLVSDTLEDKESKDVGSQSSRNGEMGWGGVPAVPHMGGHRPDKGPLQPWDSGRARRPCQGQD